MLWRRHAERVKANIKDGKHFLLFKEKYTPLCWSLVLKKLPEMTKALHYVMRVLKALQELFQPAYVVMDFAPL